MHVPVQEPFQRFAEVFERARGVQPKDPNAMTLSTVDGRGRPSSRVVLLKGFDAQGFVFFTNYESRKGKELLAQTHAALGFYWPALDEQVRIEGPTAKVSAAESDEYFASRARESQLGAWASLQSQPLDSRQTLLTRLGELEAKFKGVAVPRPPHWGGFRLAPERIEFWKAGQFRLHDRMIYERRGDGWETTVLFP